MSAIESYEDLAYSLYINPLNKDLQDKLFSVIVDLRNLKMSLNLIISKHQKDELSVKFGLINKRFIPVYEACLKRELTTKIEIQKQKGKTITNIKSTLEVLWKATVVYFGFDSE